MPAEADACLYQAPDSAKNPLRLVRERERDEMRDAERKVGEGGGRTNHQLSDGNGTGETLPISPAAGVGRMLSLQLQAS